jgi:hypothetical protein
MIPAADIAVFDINFLRLIAAIDEFVRVVKVNEMLSECIHRSAWEHPRPTGRSHAAEWENACGVAEYLTEPPELLPPYGGMPIQLPIIPL